MTARLPRRLFPAMAVFAAFAASARAQDETEAPPEAPTYAGLMAQARAAQAERKFDRARDLYRLALGLEPQSIEAREGQAACETDHFWYGRTPIEFRVPTREDWQRSQASRAGVNIASLLDPRIGMREAMGGGGSGFYQIESVGRTERGTSEFTGAVEATSTVGPSGGGDRRVVVSGPRPEFVRPEAGTGPRVPTITAHTPAGGGPRGGRPVSAPPREPTAPRIQEPPRGVDPPPSFGGPAPRDTGSRPRGPSGAEVGVAAAVLGFVLPYVYDAAVPLDLTLEPLGSSRASGFSALFGFAPMRGAATMEAGLWKVGFTYSNWFGTMEKEGVFADTASGTPPTKSPIPAAGGSGSFFRFRKNRFDEGALDVQVGVPAGFEFGVGITVANLREGHSGDDRTQVVFNRNGAQHIDRVERVANAGNLSLYGRWAHQWRPGSGVGLGLDVKIPMGDPADFATSGTVDFAPTFVFSQRLGRGDFPVFFHYNLGFMIPTGEDEFFNHPPRFNNTETEVDAMVAVFSGFGLTWRMTPHMVLLIGSEFNTSPYDAGTDSPDALSSSAFMQTFHLGLRVLFDKLFFEGSVGHDLGIGDVHGLTGRVSIALFFGGAGDRGGRGPDPRTRGVPFR